MTGDKRTQSIQDRKIEGLQRQVEALQGLANRHERQISLWITITNELQLAVNKLVNLAGVARQ